MPFYLSRRSLPLLGLAGATAAAIPDITARAAEFTKSHSAGPAGVDPKAFVKAGSPKLDPLGATGSSKEAELLQAVARSSTGGGPVLDPVGKAAKALHHPQQREVPSGRCRGRSRSRSTREKGGWVSAPVHGRRPENDRSFSEWLDSAIVILLTPVPRVSISCHLSDRNGLPCGNLSNVTHLRKADTRCGVPANSSPSSLR